MPSAFLTLVLGPHLTPPSPFGLLLACCLLLLPRSSLSFTHTLSLHLSLSLYLSPETTTHHLTSYCISHPISFFQTTTQFFPNPLIQFIRSYAVLRNQSNTKSWPSKGALSPYALQTQLTCPAPFPCRLCISTLPYMTSLLRTVQAHPRRTCPGPATCFLHVHASCIPHVPPAQPQHLPLSHRS